MWKRSPVTFVAAHVPVAFAIWCATRSFWAYGPEVFAALFLLFGSLTWLLSVSLKAALERFDAGDKRSLVMGCCVCALGLFFLTIDATLTHMGLEWLAEHYPGIFPAFALWPMSIGLALVNVFVKWAYLAPAGKPETEADQATTARSDIAAALRVVG